MYHYDAIVRSVYDGDTIRVDISLGFGLWLYDIPLRLARINTPEVRGKEKEKGILVRDYVRSLIFEKPIEVVTIKTSSGKDQTGKYGRYLAEVMFFKGEFNVPTNLNDHLLELGYAEVYGE